MNMKKFYFSGVAIVNGSILCLINILTFTTFVIKSRKMHTTDPRVFLDRTNARKTNNNREQACW